METRRADRISEPDACSGCRCRCADAGTGHTGFHVGRVTGYADSVHPEYDADVGGFDNRYFGSAILGEERQEVRE